MKEFNFDKVDDIQGHLDKHQYIADRNLSTSLFLALKMKKPIFLEGEPGVGKTEIGKVLAKIMNTDLIRLQCYEGLDVHNSIYEWNYSRQILQIRMMELEGKVNKKTITDEIFGSKFLIKRPLYKAIDYSGKFPPVLLIDELDRADEEFEAFLLEILSDYQISIPEIGTIKCDKPPIVVSPETLELMILNFVPLEFMEFSKRLTQFCDSFIPYPAEILSPKIKSVFVCAVVE